MVKTKNKRLSADFYLSLRSRWEGQVKPKKDDSDWKFQTYRGTNLSYDMFCAPTSSDNEDKEGDNIRGNRPINLKIDNQHRVF